MQLNSIIRAILKFHMQQYFIFSFLQLCFLLGCVFTPTQQTVVPCGKPVRDHICMPPSLSSQFNNNNKKYFRPLDHSK